MTPKEEELAATVFLAISGMGHEAIADMLNKAVPTTLYWPVVRGWMKLNGDKAIVLSAEGIVDYLDDDGYEPVKSVEEIRTAANQKVWECELEDTLYEALGYYRDDIREELAKEGFIKLTEEVT